MVMWVILVELIKKVVSAAKKGATVFFAPNNPVTEEAKKANPHAKSNYDTAVEAAEMIKTDMKIVPVKNTSGCD